MKQFYILFALLGLSCSYPETDVDTNCLGKSNDPEIMGEGALLRNAQSLVGSIAADDLYHSMDKSYYVALHWEQQPFYLIGGKLAKNVANLYFFEKNGQSKTDISSLNNVGVYMKMHGGHDNGKNNKKEMSVEKVSDNHFKVKNILFNMHETWELKFTPLTEAGSLAETEVCFYVEKSK